MGDLDPIRLLINASVVVALVLTLTIAVLENFAKFREVAQINARANMPEYRKVIPRLPDVSDNSFYCIYNADTGTWDGTGCPFGT